MYVSKGIRFSFIYIVATLMLLIGCGGGTDSGPSEEPVDFELSTSPNIDWPQNQVEMNQLSMSQFSLDLLTVYDISRLFIEDRYIVSSALEDVSLIIPETDCSDGGKLRVATQKLEEIWSLVLAYDGCQEGTLTINGRIVFRFSAESGYLSSEGFSILFDSYAQTFSDSTTLSFYGEVNVDSHRNPKLMSLNVTAGYQEHFFKVEDFSVPVIYEQQTSSFSGRVFDSLLGFADVNVSDGFEYDDNYFWPVDGGKLTFTGLNYGVGTVEIVGPNEVFLELKQGNAQPQALFLEWDDLDILQSPSYGLSPTANFSEVNVQGEELLSSESIALDASNSSDPENKLLTFTWSLVSGPEGHQGVLSDTESPRPLFYPDRIGTYLIQLVVNDGLNSSTPFITTVTLDSLQYRARAEWTNNQDIADVVNNYKLTNVPISMDASQSEMMIYPDSLDYINLEYEWFVTESPGGSLTNIGNSKSKVSNFTPDVPGYYTIKLVVNDGVNDSEKSYRFNVYDYELYRPTVSRSSHAFGNVNEPLTISIYAGSIYGPNADQSRWRLVSAPENSVTESIDVDGLRMTFIPDVSGVYQFEAISFTEIEESDPVVLTVYVEEESLFITHDLLDKSKFPIEGYGWAEPKALFLADLNNDSFDDLILPSADNSFSGVEQLRVLLRNDQNTGFLETTIDYSLPDPKLGVYSVEHFGNDDFNYLFHSYYTGKYELFKLDANNAPLSVWSTENSAHIMSSENNFLFHDFNNDGLKDLVTLDSYPNFDTINREFHVRLNEGLSYPSYGEPVVFDLMNDRTWFDMEAVDFTNDGNMDLIINSYNYQPSIPGSLDDFEEIFEVIYFQGDGDGGLSNAQSVTLNGDPNYYLNGKPNYVDIDADGDIDIVGITRNIDLRGGESGISYWIQDAEGNFNISGTLLHEPATSLVNTISDLNVLDLNLDGMLDIVVLNQGYLQLFLQTSPGVFDHGQSYFLSIYGRNKLTFSDIDADGDQDILATRLEEEGTEIIEFENQTVH